MQPFNRDDLHGLRAAVKDLLFRLEFNSECGPMDFGGIERHADNVRREINALAALKKSRLAVWGRAAA